MSGLSFDEWWKVLHTDGLPNVQRYRVVCKMAYTEGQKRGRTIEGQTIEQWRERALIGERQLQDAGVTLEIAGLFQHTAEGWVEVSDREVGEGVEEICFLYRELRPPPQATSLREKMAEFGIETSDPNADGLASLLGLSEQAMAAISNPDFQGRTRVHDWRNYVPEVLMNRWSELGPDVRAVAYYMADEQAGREEWE